TGASMLSKKSLPSVWKGLFVLWFSGLLSSCAVFDLSYHLKGYTVLGETHQFERDVSGQREKIDYDLLIYKREVPDETFPLMVALHGARGSGMDYMASWEEAAVNRRVMVLAPTRPRAFHNRPEDLELLYALTDEILEKYPIDRSKIYLAGVSSGALISRWMITDDPSRFKGVVFIAHNAVKESWPSRVQNLDALPPILYLQGKSDPQEKAEDTEREVEDLLSRGADVTLLEFDGGHEHKPEWTESIFDWIESLGN
ncbi:hypothetical protein N9K06_01470, partial [Omnitrophica bacterium]|nr:hypothetical protein [Candidatus Omnitrophota bacterium]